MVSSAFTVRDIFLVFDVNCALSLSFSSLNCVFLLNICIIMKFLKIRERIRIVLCSIEIKTVEKRLHIIKLMAKLLICYVSSLT